LTAEHLRQLKQRFDTLLDKIIEIKHFSHFATETPLLSTFRDSSFHLKLGFEREVEVQVLRAKIPSPNRQQHTYDLFCATIPLSDYDTKQMLFITLIAAWEADGVCVT
jgi:hypothetical protein